MIFPNGEEAAVLTGLSDEEAQLRALAARCPTVVVKRGANGAQLAQGEARLSLPSATGEALDTTGAGDAFVAAFLAGRMRQAARERCLADAIAAGALAARTPGGRPTAGGAPAPGSMVARPA
jgi:sugar/nucleoside kinase (ribokinase family)